MTQRPRTIKYDIKELVESLDPTRHEPTTEYEFSNGRKFKRRPGEWYDEAGE